MFQFGVENYKLQYRKNWHTGHIDWYAEITKNLNEEGKVSEWLLQSTEIKQFLRQTFLQTFSASVHETAAIFWAEIHTCLLNSILQNLISVRYTLC